MIRGLTTFGSQLIANYVLNNYGRHWQAPRLFVLGGSMFPNNGSANPTPTVLAFTYRAADGIVDRYFKRLTPLA
jgi:gluconate 2-dehydrogenase alpha chain